MSEASDAAAARLAPLKAWWAALAERERRLLAVAGLVVALYLVFVVTIQPAWRTLSRAPAQQEALDLQLQTMTRLAAEAGELRAMPPVNVEQSSTALKAASDRLGDKGRLSLQGDRAVLTLNGAGTEQLRGWLAEVRSGARARPVEANLARGATGYSGTIVVAIGGGT
jgi:general secretion pathway protein M